MFIVKNEFNRYLIKIDDLDCWTKELDEAKEFGTEGEATEESLRIGVLHHVMLEVVELDMEKAKQVMGI